MNINVTQCFMGDPSGGDFDRVPADDSEFLSGELKEHMEIMGRSGKWTPTGAVALVPPPDPELAAIGVLQVWIKSADGMWVYISPDGDATESACPFGD